MEPTTVLHAHDETADDGSAEAKNRAIYDNADDALWQRAVYRPVHDGRHFANIGGRPVLDHFAAQSRLGRDDEAVDLCCGSGAAACYLAERFGCGVVGLDLNDSQIERARERARCDPRLRFEVADVGAWRPDRLYDLVFTLDSLTLIPDLPGLFANARRALRPGGGLGVAEVVAGPALSPAMRDYALAEDGAINLVTADALGTIVADAGFAGVEVVSLRDQAIRAFTLIRRSVHEDKGWDPALRTRVHEWRELSDRYLSAFEAGELGYARITATAP